MSTWLFGMFQRGHYGIAFCHFPKFIFNAFIGPENLYLDDKVVEDKWRISYHSNWSSVDFPDSSQELFLVGKKMI